MAKRRKPKPVKKKRRRTTTSKQVLFATLIFSFAALAVILVAWVVCDRSDAAALAGVFAGMASISLGFYSLKAKAENLAKYGYKPQNDDTEE